MSTRASTNPGEPSRPYLGTAFALITLTILILMLVATILFVPVVGGTRVCMSGFSGPAIDEKGNIVQPAQVQEESCTGSTDWTPMVVLGGFAAFVGLGIWANIAQIRSYARRWNSPLYYPLIWTFVTGTFVALLAKAIHRPWVELQDPQCSFSGCTTSTHFSLIGSLIMWAIIAVIVIPFLLSLRRLFTIWVAQRARG